MCYFLETIVALNVGGRSRYPYRRVVVPRIAPGWVLHLRDPPLSIKREAVETLPATAARGWERQCCGIGLGDISESIAIDEAYSIARWQTRRHLATQRQGYRRGRR